MCPTRCHLGLVAVVLGRRRSSNLGHSPFSKGHREDCHRMNVVRVHRLQLQTLVVLSVKQTLALVLLSLLAYSMAQPKTATEWLLP